MNPWGLSASDILIWGIVLHLIADWPLQNHWMAVNKAKRRLRQPINPVPSTVIGGAVWPGPVPGPWWDRHPAAYVHAGIHGVFLALVFGWVAIPLAFAHLIIDTRVPVEWWARLIKQTPATLMTTDDPNTPLVGLGFVVRLWVDQVFHIMTIAIAALLVTL